MAQQKHDLYPILYQNIELILITVTVNISQVLLIKKVREEGFYQASLRYFTCNSRNSEFDSL